RRLADRQPADLSGGVQVRLDERRREAERTGDVVEPVRRIVRRKIRARIDREIEDIADRVGVLGAIQAMKAGRRGVYDGGPIELVLEPGDEAVVGDFV